MENLFTHFVAEGTAADGSPVQIDLLECGACGAAVSDEEKHRAWHERAGNTVG